MIGVIVAMVAIAGNEETGEIVVSGAGTVVVVVNRVVMWVMRVVIVVNRSVPVSVPVWNHRSSGHPFDGHRPTYHRRRSSLGRTHFHWPVQPQQPPPKTTHWKRYCFWRQSRN